MLPGSWVTLWAERKIVGGYMPPELVICFRQPLDQWLSIEELISLFTGMAIASFVPYLDRRLFRYDEPCRIEALDPRTVRRVCDEPGLDPARLPGPQSRV